jgi:hypothetical protein
MRSLRRPAAVFIAIALTGGLAACGDDSDDEATTATTTATTEAPSGADAVDLTMTEYSYTVGGDLKPGGTIRLSNEGKEFHMIGLAKLKEGKTIGDVTAVLAQFAEGPPGGDEEGGPTTTAGAGGATTTTEADTTTTAAGGSATTVAGTGTTIPGGEEEEGDPFAEVAEEIGAPGTFMGPGQKADITVPSLAEGTYAMICFIPVEGDAEETPHFARGMVGQITVAGDKAAEPTADATFRVELGKAITGPTTLTAGRRVLKFEAVGDAGEAEPGLAKLNPGATPGDINRAFEEFEEEDSFILPVNAASMIPGQLIASVFDFEDADAIYLGVDLTAGTYGIDAHDSDVEDPPADSIEQATFTVT